jgi:hypothetical protein
MNKLNVCKLETVAQQSTESKEIVDTEYLVLGDAKELTKNGMGRSSEANRGKR